jgi:SAM-dependent methyltransferase
MAARTAYDELPYRSVPIEWTAPERLALASFLHAGPRPCLEGYRVLELGCADGANLLPMAFFRSQGRFVGVDSAETQIALARTHRAMLGLENLEFVCADLREAERHLCGEFDFIIAHGVFSWIPDAVRDAMLQLCARRLTRDGLLYLNYNTFPGWNVRGMIRKLLLARTRGGSSLHDRALRAREVAAEIAASLAGRSHPYAQLMIRELEFVSENHYSWVAHEYLAEDNHAYWRSEFMQLMRAHGFEYVADADFNYPTGRLPITPTGQTYQESPDSGADDAVDLLSYRQLHSPILCRRPRSRHPYTPEEFADLGVASCLAPCTGEGERSHFFRHPSGYEVETREESMRAALLCLERHWPRAVRIGEIFRDDVGVMDDLRLLHRNGLIEFRYGDSQDCLEPSSWELLNRIEAARGYYVTTRYHTREAPAVQFGSMSEGAGAA